MIGFLLRKTFYDLWDNLFRVVLLNLGFIASAAVPVGGAVLLASVPALSLLVFAAGLLWCVVYLAACARVLKNISDYGLFGFGDFIEALKETWVSGLILGLLVGVAAVLVSIVLPFYFAMGSFIGIFAAALVFWTLLVAFLSFQYYLPLRARLERNPRKLIKKCFILFFDNPGLSLFSAFHNLVLTVVSLFLALLLPGPAGILLYLDEALRLRLLKYDYLEAHPGADRKKIPWDELLAEDREKTGTRTLKGLIFPWKD